MRSCARRKRWRCGIGSMIALLQRVAHAQVTVAGEVVGAIARGLLVFVAVERGDSEQQAERLLQRILTYRVFADSEAKMNLSVQDVKGGLMLVSQFTLAADTTKGNRPSFTPAADPATGQRLFDFVASAARQQHHDVACGRFGADMQVALVNDGPVTFWLHVRPTM